MYRKSVTGKGVVAAGAAMIAAFASSGCGSTVVARHSPAPDGATGHPASTAAGINQARAKAKAEVTNCVNKAGAAGMVTSSGRTAAINCMENLVPPDKRAELKTCLSHAVARDKVDTASGREAFESKDGPDCLNAAS
jgi:hypothetical protein